ncbi:Cof-type HAD-IIB family hydrolase [Clostridium lundense]|uniref:Cof-type HAD-IIB family hydrolase n=1 Tax=Clostridium lundense TaxID=319475 RepID=UPI000555E591|nr:Cof-type HAD-IIB family hydrolase [Clostridium lundense]
MFKLVALDIDGTLLDKEHLLRDGVIDTIKKVQEKGIKTVLVSGRDFRALKPFLRELNIQDLIIGMNGCKVYNNKGEVVFSEALEPSIGKEIIRLCEKEHKFNILFINGNTYVSESNNYLGYEYYTGSCIEVGKLSDFYKNNMDLDKIIVVDEHQKLLKIKEVLEESLLENINIEFTLPMFLEIFSKKVNKGLMLERVAKYYNIDREEILAIGDWDNDIPMIDYAGLGIAMGNASENLKKRASFITKTNEEEGAAYALKKFILSND